MSTVIIQKLRHPTHFFYSFTEQEVARWPAHDGCPVCGSSISPEIAVQLGQEHWKYRVNVGVCRECSAVHYQNPPPPEVIARYYERTWNTKLERARTAAESVQKPNSKIARLLADLGFRNFSGRVLDFGCGKGSLMRGLEENGFRDLWGLEASPPRAAIVASAFPGRVHAGPYETIPFRGQFDVIYANHVFEHLYEPLKAFDWMVERLTRTGLIVICVPDARWEPVINQVLFLPHLHSLTHQSFAALGARHGLKTYFWKHGRNDEICVAFARTGAELAPNPDCFLEAKSGIPKLSHTMQVSRLREIWEQIGAASGGTYTYALTHTLSDPGQRRCGHAKLSSWQVAALSMGGRVAQIFQRWGWTQAARHLAFVYSRASRPGCQITSWNFIRLAGKPSSTPAPVIGAANGMGVFHIK